MNSETDEVIGKSKVAGKKAVYETGISRAIISIGILVPTISLMIFEWIGALPKDEVSKLVLTSILSLTKTCIIVPFSLAAFP